MFIGVTDKDWYTRLSSANVDEANFWRPGGTPFRALEPGGLFLFKLHAPDHAIVGGGHFLRYLRLPVSLAWSAYGERNGCRSLEELKARLARYNPATATVRDPEVGCVLLAETFWFQRDAWIPAPASWAMNIVQGRGYTSADPDYQQILTEVAARLGGTTLRESQADYQREYVAHARLGQGAFRALVTESYGRRCAVTGERTLPVLDAAHIKPFTLTREHRISNGLLLRADLHRLFDEGLVTITPDLRIEVSRRIREEYENGRDYYALAGQPLRVTPDELFARPDPEMLRWHNENLFAG